MTVNVNHIWCDLVMHTLRSLYWTNRMLHGKGVKKFSALVPLILFQAQFIIVLKWYGGGKVSRFIFKLLLESTLIACVPYLPTGLITLLLLKACYSFLSVPTHMHSIRSIRGFNLARQRNKAWALIRKVLTRTTRQASRNSARLLLMRWHIWSGGFTWLFEKVFRPSLPRFLTDTTVQGDGVGWACGVYVKQKCWKKALFNT